MDYRCWEDNKGNSPVLEVIHVIKSKDARSGRSIEQHLKKLKKYAYPQLTRHRIVKKLKGKNPLKIHELRMALPDKYARIFFVIQSDGIALLLHLIIKKTDDTPLKDIEVAEARVRDT